MESEGIAALMFQRPAPKAKMDTDHRGRISVAAPDGRPADRQIHPTLLPAFPVPHTPLDSATPSMHRRHCSLVLQSICTVVTERDL